MIQVPRFNPGDNLSQTFLDTMSRAITELQNRINGASPSNETADVIQIKNNSGAARDIFDVLGIDGVYIDPSDDENENAFMSGEPVFTGVTPSDPDHVGKFAILLEPLESGQIGPARVAGVCQVMLVVDNDADNYADILDGDATVLKSGSTGAAQILWRSENDSTPRWAVVRFPVGGETSGWCKITSAEGDAPPFLYSAIEIFPYVNGTFSNGSSVFSRNLYNVSESTHPGCGKVPVNTPVIYYKGDGCYLFNFPYYRGTYG